MRQDWTSPEAGENLASLARPVRDYLLNAPRRPAGQAPLKSGKLWRATSTRWWRVAVILGCCKSRVNSCHVKCAHPKCQLLQPPPELTQCASLATQHPRRGTFCLFSMRHCRPQHGKSLTMAWFDAAFKGEQVGKASIITFAQEARTLPTVAGSADMQRHATLLVRVLHC